jgi:hypothetical protein
MYPPVLLMHHELGRSLLQYRFDHRVGASVKALSYNNCERDKHLYKCIVWPHAALLKLFHPIYIQDLRRIIHFITHETDLPDYVLCEHEVLALMGYEQTAKECIHSGHKLKTFALEDVLDEEEQQVLAKSLKRVARDYSGGNCNYHGTMFPWESAFTGTEVCPCIAGGTCWYEQHITGDVGFAVQQYWQATHDREWLVSTGFPLIYDIANFWVSRGKTCTYLLCTVTSYLVYS